MAEVSRVTAMRSSWRTETGQLACCWSEVGQRVPYNPGWMQETSESRYVPPVPAFASHSAFGGASCSYPIPPTRNKLLQGFKLSRNPPGRLIRNPIPCGARFCDCDRECLTSRWLSWQFGSLRLLLELEHYNLG